MTRAVLKNGVIVPVTPLPPDWTEGTELEVERVQPFTSNGAPHEEPLARLEAFVQGNDPEDEKRLEDALAEIRREAKQLAKQGKW